MVKLAVFVEGQTERIFVERLLKEIVGQHRIAIDCLKVSGGKNAPKTYTTVSASNVAGKQFYVLIYDCGNDSRVASEIIDQYGTLSVAGYSSIVGLRDLYPHDPDRLPAIMGAIKAVLPREPIPASVIIAVKEVEAWFLAEDSHFERVDSRLSVERVRAILAERSEDCRCDLVAHPSDSLHAIYATVSRSYSKDRAKVQRIVDALDCARLYLDLPREMDALRELVQKIEDFLEVRQTLVL